MIDDTYSRLLLGQVTDAVIERLSSLDNDELARQDLERIRRLTDDGQVSNERLFRALERIKGNEALGAELRGDAAQELKAKRPERDASLPADLKLPNPSAYNTADVLLPGDWPTEDLSKRGWESVRGRQLTNFLAQIGPVDGVIRVIPETTDVHWRLLPWYEGVALIRLSDPNWPDPRLVLYYLTLNGNLHRLNGTSPPLHEVNAKAPIHLDEGNVLDYLRFFCFFVQGDEGPFYVVERADDPWIPQMDRTEAVLQALEGVTPAVLKEVDDPGRFHCSAVLFYSNAVFRAEMRVLPSGMIEMLSDDPIAAELPSKVEAPLTWKR